MTKSRPSILRSVALSKAMLRSSSIALLAWLACLPSLHASDVNASSQMQFENCTIGGDRARFPAECANFKVPLNPQMSDGSTLSLRIARIRSRKASTESAFTVLAGGPGQSAIDSFAVLAGAFRYILDERDLILIDQRGTGASAALQCAREEQEQTFETDLDVIAEQSRRCRESLNHDPQWFTTSIAVQDLEAVRDALGYRQWDLYGVSYGTRVALHYLRRYPDKVRTLILDAVVPPGVPLGPDIPAAAQQSLDTVFARCQQTAGCREAFPDLDAEFDALMNTLRDAPREVEFENIASGRRDTMQFTADQLAVTLRLLSYNAQTAILIPTLIHNAVENDNFAALARQTHMQTENLDAEIATGMHHAVVCTEDIPFARGASETDADNHEAINPRFPGIDDSYLGQQVVDAMRASCTAWDSGYIDTDFHAPLASAVPTLILSGSADPITPPVYGQGLMETFEQALHIVNEGQGHTQAPLGCLASVMAEFVATASTRQLSTECLERLRPPAFFVDANGPLP